jgi:glycine dehydrogenase subunit 1
MYMASLGGTGMHELAIINHDKSEYLKKALRQSGFKIPFEGPTFNEFVVVSKTGFEKTYERLLSKKIVAGLPLVRFYPDLVDHYLFCVTETMSKEKMDILVQEVKS